MDYQNGQFISAYTANDTLFEGKVYTRKDGTKVCLREDKKWVPLDKLKMIRVIESAIDTSDIQSLIDDDIGKCDMDKIGKLDDGALEKLGNSREEELMSSGVKMDKGAYSQGFISKVKAQKVADDANAGNISTSTALEKYKQSKDVDINQRINQTLKENMFDDMDTEKAYSVDPTIDMGLDDDFVDEGFEDDDIYDNEESSQDWDAIEDAVDNFNEDDLYDDDFGEVDEDDGLDGWTEDELEAFYAANGYGDEEEPDPADRDMGEMYGNHSGDVSFFETKKNGGYDCERDKRYDDNLDKQDLPDSKPAEKKEESSEAILNRMRTQITERVDAEIDSAIEQYLESEMEEAIVPYICNKFGVQINLNESKSNEDLIEEAKKAIVEARMAEVSVSGIYQVCKAIYPKIKSVFKGMAGKPDYDKNPIKAQLFNPNVEFAQLDMAKQWCQQHINDVTTGVTLAVRQLKVQAGQPPKQVGALVPVATR